MSLAVTDPTVWSLFALKTAAGACGLIGTEALVARSLRPTRRLVLCLGLFLGIGLYASLFSLATPVPVIAGAGWLRAVLDDLPLRVRIYPGSGPVSVAFWYVVPFFLKLTSSRSPPRTSTLTGVCAFVSS